MLLYVARQRAIHVAGYSQLQGASIGTSIAVIIGVLQHSEHSLIPRPLPPFNVARRKWTTFRRAKWEYSGVETAY